MVEHLVGVKLRLRVHDTLLLASALYNMPRISPQRNRHKLCYKFV